MNESAKFWDKIAKRYAKSPIADEAAYQKKLEVTRDYFQPDMQVLEIGCGTGGTAMSHAPYVKHIRATDISSKMIDIAKKKANESGVDNVTFECSGIAELKVPDQSLDAVLGMSILHLLENKEAVIARIHQMLKPGGVFVSSTTCLSGMMRVFKIILPIGRWLGLLPLVKFFTSEALVDSLTHAGFEIEHLWQPKKDAAVFIVAKKP